MNRKEVMEFFNQRPRNSLLITSNGKGKVNVAVYGSPKMIDENTVVLATRDSRSYQYLRESSGAVLMIAEPGEISRKSKGIRVYLELTAIETEGDLLNKFKTDVASRAGKESAEALKAAIRFKITEVRALVDPI
jgi:hypothetical protein